MHLDAHRLHGWRRPLLVALAVAFAAWTVVYAICWIITNRPSAGVELGFDAPTFLDTERALLVRSVSKDSPAERAGLLPGDRIVAIDGTPLRTRDALDQAWSRHRPGDRVTLAIERPGTGEILLVGYLRRPAPASGSAFDRLATEVRSTIPIPFVLIGLTVLFLRLDDRNAWVLALLFGSFTTISGVTRDNPQFAPPLLAVVRTYHSVFIGLVGPLFYWFFAIFPVRSSIDRRLPWLKYGAAAFGLWMAANGVGRGQPLTLPASLAALLHDPGSSFGPFWFEFTFLTLGLVSLALSFHGTSSVEAKRRVRVLFWGTVVGIVPGLVTLAVENALGVTRPPAVDTLNAFCISLFPLSFAYAVVKHRVLEIPVLLKRSVRYLLVQRGFAVLLSLVTIALTLLFAVSLAGRLRPVLDPAGPSGIVLGAVFGSVVFWGGLRVHRNVSGQIDRAFFRSAYDARVVLEDLADQTRTARDRQELAALLERSLTEALKPEWLIVYLAGQDGHLLAMAGRSPAGLEIIHADTALLAQVAENGQPCEWPEDHASASGDAALLAAMTPECLVPLLGRGRRLAGILVLGPRLSEEPYSGEDKRLLASVASQAAIALDNMRFAEEIAERVEQERRTAREMEIARDVQSRLLPQAPPALATVECAARCVQARSVGGDYYDFLDVGADRVGFVLADVSGKGVHAALLSASLQAHLRSQAALAPLDPVRLLGYVNDVLWKSTAPQHYATLFFGIYDDRSRRLRFVNCGHNAPVLLHAGGRVDRLAATAPAVGLFDRWAATACEVQLSEGDVLAIFSDGITEATRNDEEYGEERFLERLEELRARPASEIVSGVLESVQVFSAGAQSDDLTLMVIRVAPATREPGTRTRDREPGTRTRDQGLGTGTAPGTRNQGLAPGTRD